MRGRALASIALAAIAISCAKMAPPPGGEVDRDPPKVDEAVPPDNAYGVAPDSAFTLVFSERPDRRSVLRALTIFPPVGFAESSWEDARLRLVPDGGWAEGRPTLVLIAGTAKDGRGNEMGKTYRTRFSTTTVPDSGEAVGKVWTGQEIPPSATVTVFAFDAAATDSLDPVRDSPFALAEAHAGGEFEIDGLDTGREYHVVALYDRDGDFRPEARGEAWSRAPGMAIFLEPDEPRVTVPDFLLGTLDSLGTLSGEVIADSGDVAIVFARDEERRAAHEVLTGGGAFTLTVPTGREYHVGAFLDADADSLPDEEEPRVDLEETFSLRLTAERSHLSLDLTGLGTSPDSAAADTAGAGTDEGASEAPPGPPADEPEGDG